jgi:hypothetical protein
MTKCRSEKDYAIEFAGYLANSAERYMAAVNSLDSAREGSDRTIEDATIKFAEAAVGSRSDIYEFRTRAYVAQRSRRKRRLTRIGRSDG